METQKPTEPVKSESQISAPDAPILNPLAELVSHFEDDPYWDVMMDSIRRNRREMDAAWDNVE